MYAVIRTGGKQYKVAENDVLAIERLSGEKEGELTFSDVLALHDGTDLKVGAPFVEGAVVTADIVDQSRGAKVIVFKKQRRQGYRRKKGHRQLETVIRITSILAAGQKKTAAKTEAPKEDKAEAVAAPADETAPAEAPAAKAAPKKKAAAKKPAAKKAPAKKPAAKKPAEQKD
jgi:large subunit ribosomal protein L21